MIKLIANNTPLLLNSGTEITVKELNPLFESEISGTAYPISIPAGDNMVALKFMHRPGTKLQQLPISMQYGSHYRAMLGVITKASPKGYELSLKLDDSAFTIQNGDKNLRDIDMGITTTFRMLFDNPDDFRILGTNKFCVPELPNPEFFKDTNLDQYYGGVQNDISSGHEYKPVTPFFFLKDIIKAIFSNGGYAIRGEFDDIFNRTFLYSNTSVYNYMPAFFGSDRLIEPKYHLPEITVREFLKEVCLYFNYKMIFDHSGKTVQFYSLDTLLSQPAVEDLSEYAISDFVLTDEEQYDYITLLHEVESADAASPWQEDQNYDSSSGNTYPATRSVGDRHLIEWENMIYRYNEASDGTLAWEKYSITYPLIKVGTESANLKEFKTKFSALARSWNKNFFNSDYGLAHAGYKGNTRSRTDEITHPKRFGILTDSGTAKVSTSFQSLVTGDFDGSINSRYSRSFQWLLTSRRQAEITLKLPSWKLFGFDMTKKYIVNGVTFYVAELNYKLTNHGIEYSPAKVRLS